MVNFDAAKMYLATLLTAFAHTNNIDFISLQDPCQFVSKDVSLSVAASSSSIDDYLDFDFSSKAGWDRFYQQKLDDDPSEWHSSVPLETLAELVPYDAHHCLVVGCGTSQLPSTLQKARPTTSIALLDSSATCLDELKVRYGETMKYICGDATKMSSLVDHEYDVLLDKGLMDAIFCGDGWEAPITSLVEHSSRIMAKGGSYVLVSYKLPRSTRDFLQDAGAKHGLSWQFDVKGSNGRVGISIGTKS